MTFLEVWVAYAVVGVTVFSAVFVWAVRNRQFTDFDRARYIALRDQPEAERASELHSRLDKYVLVGIVLITCAALLTAIVFGLGNG